MKILNLFKKIKRKIKVESRKKSDYVKLDGEVISYSRVNLFKILSAVFFICSLILIAFFYTYKLVNKTLNDTEEQRIEPIKIVIPYPNSMANIDDSVVLKYKIKSGDVLSNILIKEVGATPIDSQTLINSLKNKYDIRSLKAGQTITIKYRTIITDTNDDTITEKISLDELRIPLSAETEMVVVRNDDGNYFAKKLDIPLVKYYMKYYVEINDSLFEDGLKAGVTASIMLDLIKYYSFDVDFQRDIRKGDSFEILFDSYYREDGEKVRDGNILYASLKISKANFELYRYKTEAGYYSYFDGKGKSIQKSLLKTPINGARISSNYGVRKHPILGYTKAHRGIDFAAPTGTPFFAAGDGVIVRIGWNGGFGNYIRIKHNKTYDTEYGHISRFAKGLKVGTRVRQGQVIAYVGSTGMSTGPHLHYGILYNGERINPMRVKSVSNTNLIGKELIRFQQEKEKIDNYRFNTPNQNRRYR